MSDLVYQVERDAAVEGYEIEGLRESIGWDRFPKYDLILPNSYTHFSVRHQNRLVGFLNVISDGIADAFLVDLLVASDVRRKGIGKALIKKAVADLTEDGIKCIQVTFTPKLEEFYQKCGFHIFKAGIIDNQPS